jgi:DNA-binding response OmpR family regulator
VDGSTDEREMYAEYFRLRGMFTLQADNADDGYRLTAERHPAVVITVVSLPGTEDGLALTRRLKCCDGTRLTPVIVLTGHVRERDRQAAERAGCDRFVVKPCGPETLAAVVEELLVAHR